MTKQLAQYSVPAENSRVIRVFLSSTFRDMEMERSALVKLFKGLQVKAASLVLPAQILDYFLISGVEQTSQEIHISLDEKMNPKLSNDVHFESKGFMEAVNVTDFPIRDHKVILKIRRRRWTDLRTGKSFSMPIDLDIVAKGTRYSKEFGSFLKETYGDIPGDLPYA